MDAWKASIPAEYVLASQPLSGRRQALHRQLFGKVNGQCTRIVQRRVDLAGVFLARTGNLRLRGLSRTERHGVVDALCNTVNSLSSQYDAAYTINAPTRAVMIMMMPLIVSCLPPVCR